MDNQEKEAKVVLLNKGERTIVTESGEFKPESQESFSKSEADKLLSLFDGEVVYLTDSEPVNDKLKTENEELKAKIAELEKDGKQVKAAKKQPVKKPKVIPIDKDEPETKSKDDEVLI